PTAKALDAYLELLDGCDLPWAGAVIGGDGVAGRLAGPRLAPRGPVAAGLVGGDVVARGLARLALERGGHVRVGLEDYAGPATPSNVELVEQVAALAGAVGRPVATPADAARLLDLPRR